MMSDLRLTPTERIHIRRTYLQMKAPELLQPGEKPAVRAEWKLLSPCRVAEWRAITQQRA